MVNVLPLVKTFQKISYLTLITVECIVIMASFILIYSNFPLCFLSMNRYPDLATSLTFLKTNDFISLREPSKESTWGKWAHRVTW